MYFSVPEWEMRFGIAHGFFGRRGGSSPPPFASLNVGPKGGDGPANVSRNLEGIARALSVPAERIFCASQVHRDHILRVSAPPGSIFGPEKPVRADGLITTERGVYLGVLTADCVPLLLFDPRRSAVGAVHAGWRGTVLGIATNAVQSMQKVLGCRVADIRVAFGPAIGPCCYVVGEEVVRACLEHDASTRPFLRPAGSGRWKMNLSGINLHQLIAAGIREENVVPFPHCTCCRRDLFFSVRAEGDPTGRQLSLIGLRPETVPRRKAGLKVPGDGSEKKRGVRKRT